MKREIGQGELVQSVYSCHEVGKLTASIPAEVINID